MGVLAQACFTLPTNLILRRQNNIAMAAPVSGVGFGSVGEGTAGVSGGLGVGVGVNNVPNIL